MHSLQPNSTFATRYQVIRCIAAGGMGAVYEVVHLETERKRALKVMHAHFVQSAELRERFKREAKVAAQIDSEFVVDVFDAGIDEATNMPFLVMELLKGEELGRRLAAVGRFAPPEAITYLWQTALALDKTHKANIVHRDLKPENLFLTEREDGPPRIKVLDFGVAKFIAETGTQAGQTRSLGTPLYMSPEQFRGQKVAGRSDNFALAMMAYTLLVGAPYWSEEAGGDTDIVAFALRAHAGPVEPARLRASRAGVALPEGFDAWFWKATASDPSVRFPSATATIAGLGEVFGIHPARMTGVAASDPMPPSLAMGMSHSGPSRPSMPLGTVALAPLTGDAGVLTKTASHAPKKSGPIVPIVIVALGISATALVAGLFALRPHGETSGRASAADNSVANAAAVDEISPGAASNARVDVTASAVNSAAPEASPSAAAEPVADAARPTRPTKKGSGAATPRPTTPPPPPSPTPLPPPPVYSRD